MIDRMIPLAFAMATNPGAYALLLGSGVSRSAGIPTGWEVLIDLVDKYRAAGGIVDSSDPIDWYRSTVGVEPAYSAVLAEIAPKPAERMAALRSYFEPNDLEREQGLKVPSSAH